MKKLSKYTRGPWRLGFTDGSGPAHIIARVDGAETSVAKLRWGCSCCENVAYSLDDLEPYEKEIARLIAAAPELYEALKDATHFVNMHCEPWYTSGQELLTKLRAALAKVEQS